jgi:CBS domain-containing protein
MFDFDVREGNEVPSSREALGFHRLPLDTRVTEIPRGPALTLAPEASIATAIEAMRQRHRGSAVVIRNQRALGIVSDRDILAQACGEIDDLCAVPISAVMVLCPDPLRETDTIGTALRKMCALRQWHLPIACARGLFVGALDVADMALWFRDRITVLSIEAAFA